MLLFICDQIRKICSVNFGSLGRSYLFVVVVSKENAIRSHHKSVIAEIISTKRRFPYIVVECYWGKARGK